MTKNSQKHITLPAHFYAEPASEGHTLALLHLIAQEDRVAIYGHDGYEAADERHEQLACLIVDAASFQNAVINWLAWRLGIPEDSLQNLPEKLPEIEDAQAREARLHRHELALDTLLTEFRRVPEHMGDENFGGKLARILMASRNFAQGNQMSEEEYRQEISEEYDGRN